MRDFKKVQASALKAALYVFWAVLVTSIIGASQVMCRRRPERVFEPNRDGSACAARRRRVCPRSHARRPLASPPLELFERRRRTVGFATHF